MITLDGNFLVVHFTIDSDCAQRLEDTTTGRLTHHGSFLGVILADGVIWKLDIGVNGMHKIA